MSFVFGLPPLLLLLASTTANGEPPPTATPCDEIIQYQVADAHPDIRWIAVEAGAPGGTALSCIVNFQGDDGSLELKNYMSSGLYKFLRQCPEVDNVTYRLFQYKDNSRPYLLRLHRQLLAEPRTYIVVASYRKPAGNFQHAIAEASNSALKIRHCPPQTSKE